MILKINSNKYKLIYNNIDILKPLITKDPKNVLVIGAGLAGIAVATVLAQRGFNVKIIEKNSYILGKVGAWKNNFEDGTEEIIEHGYHGFFKQYYNLRNFLKEIGSYNCLIPLDDYLIKNSNGRNYSFKNINNTPIINMVSMLNKNKFNLIKIFSNPKHVSLLKFLGYKKDTYFKKYDSLSLKEFANSINMDPELESIFTTFARAFFSKPEDVSLAELFRASHYYFTGNNKGILYDVMNDDYNKTLVQPVLSYLNKLKIKLDTNNPVNKIKKIKNKFIVNNSSYDYLIIASDIAGTKQLLNNIEVNVNEQDALSVIKDNVDHLHNAPSYGVLRIWIDKDIDKSNPFCIMPNNYKFLDLIAAYHRIEKSSTKWHQDHNGYIFELHSYALDTKLTNELEIQKIMLQEFEFIFPEIKGYKIYKSYFQLRDNFTAFEKNNNKYRPCNETQINNMYFAGDWVNSPLPAMLMEGAFSSGMMAANNILSKENLQEEPIYTVPINGILSKLIH